MALLKDPKEIQAAMLEELQGMSEEAQQKIGKFFGVSSSISSNIEKDSNSVEYSVPSRREL